jgi:hypothetical protein
MPPPHCHESGGGFTAAATPKGRLTDRPYFPPPAACSTAFLIALVTTLTRRPKALLSFDLVAIWEDEITSRVCTGCGVEQPLTSFHKHQQGIGGVRPRCKACIRAADPRRARAV